MDTIVTTNGAGRPTAMAPHDERPALATSAPLRAATVMSWLVAGMMIVASAAGLFVHDLYHEGAWAREALRGGDLVTLAIAAPVLIVALVLASRGSRRAQAVWIGVIAYTLYNYAFYAFGAAFNDLFLLHIALLSLSVFTLACAIPSLDVVSVADRLRNDRTARWVGGFLMTVGVLQGALWIFVLLRNVATGAVIEDIPVRGQHLVFALDLGLAMPALVVAGVLLIRHRAMGYLLGAAVTIFGALEQLNLMVGGVFQAYADVTGIKAFPPESILLTSTFLIAAVVMLRGRRSRS
jgi:hypothetical protein